MFPLTFLARNQVQFWFTLPKRQYKLCPELRQCSVLCCDIYTVADHPELTFRLLLPVQSIYGFFSLLLKCTCLQYGINKCTENKCFSPAPRLLTNQPPLLKSAYLHICIYVHRYAYVHIYAYLYGGGDFLTCENQRSRGECSP